ncbi:MAG: amidohydrolase [Planctomycetes bacterium]|nr:amidohydrolase [Planctomycetota bacterium]
MDLVILADPSVAVTEGRVAAAGPRGAIRPLALGAARVLDLGDARLFPGLRDSHAHLVPTGLAARRVDLHGMTLDRARAALAARVRTTPPGQWVLGRGFSLADLEASRPPSAGDLDDIAPDNPVRISSHDLHALWVNTRALAAAGRPAEAPSYLLEDEVRLFMDAAGRENDEERLAAARDAQALFHAAGITAVQDHGLLADLRAVLALAESGKLLLRVGFSVRDHELPGFLAAEPDLPRHPDLVTVNGQKAFLDGALGSRTAWTLDPYLDGSGSGHRALGRKEARDRVAFAASRGLPTFLHAIGDGAVREALDLFAEFPLLPHRVEHAQLVHPDDLPRFARQNVMASVQTCHLLTDTPDLRRLWGDERAARSFPLRSLVASGAEVRLGSDTPVEPLDPMRGVFAACARRTLDGAPLPGEESLPADEALRLYYSFPEIVPGVPADLVAFPRDPATVPHDVLPRLRPCLTVFAGNVVFAGGAPPR